MTSHEIRALRLALGLSQEEFARELGISFASVNRWENNRAVPSRLAERQLEQLRRRVERLHA